MSTPVPQNIIEAFQGLPQTHAFKKVPWNWICPACNRNVLECIRLDKKGKICTTIYKHKLSKELICVDCSNVQSNLKTQGHAGDWQLSLQDIATIIKTTPHKSHEVKIEKFLEIKPALAVQEKNNGKTSRNLRAIKIPDKETWRETVINFSRSLDRSLSEDWRCPACNRTKYETVMWHEDSRHGTIPAGFRLFFVRHHDHAASKTELINGRFPVTIICRACNDADGRLKTYFNMVEDNWSFSPSEIKEIITVTNHNTHKVDFEKAKIILERILGKVIKL